MTNQDHPYDLADDSSSSSTSVDFLRPMPSNHPSLNNSVFAPPLNILPPSSLFPPTASRIHHYSPYDSDDYTDTTASVSSVPLSLTTSNHSTPSVTPKIPQLPFHNPRFLGSIPFYYPRRPSPISAETPASNSTQSVPSPSSTPPSESHRSNRFHQSTIDVCWSDFQSSCSSLQKNEHWGDNIDIKPDHSFRIYFQNLNSCGLSTSTDKWSNIMTSMHTEECDIINFAQTSLNWRIMHLRERMRKVISRLMPIYKLHIGRNKFISEQSTLPGGTAQIVKGDWTGRIVEYLQDPRQMGRYCGTKLRLKHDRFLVVISAYRVCNQSGPTLGVETAMNQQRLMLTLDGMYNPNPRQQFITDLSASIKAWQSPKTEILLLLDANESLGSSTHGLADLMRNCKLLDLFHHHHGVCPDFATFDMGSNRLDYALGSPTLLPFLLRCGYLPFYQGVASDHRGLFLDFSQELIDGLTHLERTPTRFLHSNYQESVYRYKQQVHAQFLSHNIIQKATDLYNSSDPSQCNDSKYIEKLNTLDQLMVSIQLKAEQQVCKRRTKLDFSDDIHFTKIIVAYWNLHRKNVTRKRDVSVVSKSIYASLPEAYQKMIDVASRNAYHNWCGAKHKLRQLMVEHRTLLAVLSKDLVDNEATLTGRSAEDIVRTQEQKKQDKKLYTSLRQHFHPATRSGIAHLLLPDKDLHGNPTDNPEDAVTWKTETDPAIVLDRLLQRNIQHFGQAAGTPFTTDPLLSTFGYTGMSSDGEAMIQDGTIPSLAPTVSESTSLILNRLSDTTKSRPSDSTLLSFEAFQQAIRKWRESTSTSPSGRHLGHYKSLLALDAKSSTYTEALPDPGPIILQAIFQVASSAFQSGVILERWRHVTTCMIEKLPGVPRINKLRVIHLYEADYNACLKLIWQRGIIWSAHHEGLLNPAQAGSRPHHTCQEVVLSKALKYNYSCLTRSSMATMDNDAKSCYDRVVASLALLISNHFGVPTATCSTVGQTLQNMIFRIRTALGDSPQTYTHSASHPVHGVGQGGTASPAFWLLVSSILFDCFQSKAQGMTMVDPTENLDPTKTTAIRQWLEAIVDDTSIFTNLPHNSNIADLIQALQHDSQLWENLLSTSGGCLELPKCFYYVLAWVFSNEGIASPMSQSSIDAISPRIRLQEFGQEQFTTIQSKDPHESHKTLGVLKNMVGDDSDHLKTLESRSRNMAAIVATGGLHPYQTEVAVRMIYTTAMGYSLPTINVTASKIDKIQYKALESFVPALGYNPGFPRCIVLGPSDFGGLGIPHLYTEAHIQKIELLIMHLRSNSTLGKLMMTILNWTQLHAGTCTPILEDHSDLSYVDDNWLMGIREFLISINGKLVIPASYRPILERQHDCCLMESFRSLSPKPSKNQLRHLLAWRLFFRVQTLSDITNAAGNTILAEYITRPTSELAQPIRIDRLSKLLWPHQLSPASATTFSLWVRTLRRCFLHAQGSTLRQPLGQWLVSPTTSLSTWQAYLHCNYTSLIVIRSNTIRRYTSIQKHTASTISFDATTFETLNVIPDTYIPVAISNTPGSLIAHHAKQKQLHQWSRSVPSPTDIQEAIQAAPSWQKTLLQHFRIHNLDLLISSLTDDTSLIFSVSDGGMRDGCGSFGVTVGTSTDILYYIEGPASGFDDLMTSFRSEAYGMLASLSFLCLFIQVHQIHIPPNRSIQTYCDNLALVDWINKLLREGTHPRQFLRPEMDVVMQILHDINELKLLHVDHKFYHVLGHQDKDIPYDQLSRPAQLNVNADFHATNYLNNCKSSPYQALPANPVNFYIDDDIITRDYKHRIRRASRSPDLRIYMVKRFNWKAQTPDLIWWQVHGSTIESFAKADRRRITKFIFLWLPTCARLHSYDTDVKSRCPSCKSTSETHMHLIKCQAGTRPGIKSAWLVRVEAFLEQEQYTPSLIYKILFGYLESLLYDKIVPEYPNLPSNIQRAYTDQTTIGWYQLINGRLALSWGNCIATHLSINRISDKEMTALSWGRKFNKMMFRLSLDLWQCRNSDAHTPTKSHRQGNNDSPLLKERLMDQITAMQQSQPAVRLHDRDFIYKPLSILQQYRVSHLRAWYKAACSIIKHNRLRIQNNRPRNMRRSHGKSQFSISVPDNPELSSRPGTRMPTPQCIFIPAALDPGISAF